MEGGVLTFLVDAPVLFLLGAAFGMFARRAENPFAARAFVCGAAACLIVGIGVPLAAYARYPDWMWGYYVEADDMPIQVVAMLFLFYWAPFLAGFAAPYVLERLGPGLGWGAFAIGLLGQAILLVWQWPRYSTVTSLQGFRAGHRVPPGDIPLLQLAFPLSVATIAILLWLARPKRTS